MNAQENDRRLDRYLAALPREIAPRRDLYADIKSAAMPVGERPHQSFRLALGAVAGFMLGVGFLWLSLGNHSVDAALDTVQASSKITAARSVQVSAYRARLPMLDAKTRARVERDLALILQAQADLAAALRSTPENAALARLYENALRQEFEFYNTVVQSTEPLTTGTQI